MAKWVFWADEIADKIINRKKFDFTEKTIPKEKQWTVKSSSSLSGVLHIGRLSDIIRGEAEARALKEKGFPAEFIYVTEDMDPLRKIPKGVPKEFEQYIGFPVSDVPDPHGCHSSYAEHFTEEFLKVFKDFLFLEPEVYSMRKEYKKGNFTKEIIELVKKTDEVKKIIEKVQGSEVGKNWSVWKPICEKCGNLQTTVITKIEGEKIHYKCQDYAFEKFTAKGCGHEGISDLNKANGKLVWKSEWAAQWKRWKVCSEGAGKEYESRNSAFWVNAEISEKVLNFPHPEPIFYEHIIIGGAKMSASVGNIVYPFQWLEVAKPETLKYLYMKRLMKTRSFDWIDVPLLELELDRVLTAEKNNEGDEIEQLKNSKYKNSVKVKGREIIPLKADYSLIAFLNQFCSEKQVIEKLKEMDKIEKGDKKELESLKERINLSKAWLEKYAPEENKIVFSEELKKKPEGKIKEVFSESIKVIEKESNPEEIQQKIYSIGKEKGVQPKELFKEFYLFLIEKEKGPRLGQLIIAIGKDKVLKKLEQVK
ncbi:MAG: lysine--tRNA ligase [Candidatus Diapherotrites archaeon CG10_big_fil_rev_8_21_14_0_10_31_34]|nr:MAG: lysine--tRNA ligase [Candidatus Diapherotrites archaeon CG10_big_fil_rev_8_21_14_0_10_31_34]PJA16304.1 MAG: lysine--tRNA ligase [Candidatus Diapherotrites archaeon CG_4_10_14_0_2_um_filter_31_5]